MHRSGWLRPWALLCAVWCGLLCAPFGAPFGAPERFVVEDIRIEGLARISSGTVFNYLPLRVGEELTPQRAAEIVRALYKTGFFRDVQLAREGDVLLVTVVERPAIAEITFSGNDDLDTEDLLTALKDIGLAEGRAFDRSLLEKVEQELKQQYFSRGKYGVEVQSTVTPLERNRVGLAIAITEGEVARIAEINLIGNRSFEEEDLLDRFSLSTPNFLSFYTDDDQYSKEKLAADLEILRSFYLDRGFLNFNVDSTQVSITPDRRSVFITINIAEGDRYTVREVKLAGELEVPAEELFPLIAIRAGELFSRKQAVETASALTERLGDEGYAFANVNTVPEVDEAAKQVSLTLFVDPGKRVYVRNINFAGNSRTRDEVLRREMRQMEGGWFSTSAIKRSRERLQRLGYFEEVNVETPAVPGTSDQVDVNYGVKERLLGSLQLGVGYSQLQGILFNVNVTQDNFLGSGNRVSANFNNSRVNSIYSFSYNNPYYTLDGISRGFSLFSRETDAREANVSNYTTDILGGTVNFGVPINEFDRVRLTAGVEDTSINTSLFSPIEVTGFIAANGDNFKTVRFSAAYAHDTRNKAIFADRGLLSSIEAEVSVPGLDLNYYKLSAQHQRYIPLTRALTLSLNAEAAYGDGYGETTQLPFFENFFAGGPRSVRGFEENTLGPRDSNDNPLGANLRVIANAELLFPIPFQGESKSLRLALFADAGNVFDEGNFDAGELRYSAGISLIWLSPVGPLSFSLSQPFNDQEGDDVQPFQFTLGAAL